MKTPTSQPNQQPIVALSVRIPESLRKEMRLYALQRDMTVTDLVARAFAALKEKEKGKG